MTLEVLQVLRALAALFVCFFHLSLLMGTARYGGSAPFFDITRLGYLGVDFFFALSGFIIVFAHHGDVGRPERMGRYAIKRFIRIYPLYWLITAVVVAGAMATGGTSHSLDEFRDIASMVTLVRFTGYNMPVHPAWTLFHEVFFYSVFLLAIWRRSAGLVAMACWLALLLLVNFLVPTATSNAFLDMVAAPVNFAFFGGMASFFLYRRLGRAGAASCALAGVSLFLLALARIDSDADHAFFKVVLSLSFMLVLAGLTALERLGIAWRNRFLVAVGNASFMLYLTHENVQSWVLRLIHAVPGGSALNDYVVYFLVVAACVAFSLLAYRWLEKPVLNLLRARLLPPPKAARPGLGVAV